MQVKGTVTAATASNGVATFNNLFFSLAGGYVLNISDGNLTQIKTGKITVK